MPIPPKQNAPDPRRRDGTPRLRLNAAILGPRWVILQISERQTSSRRAAGKTRAIGSTRPNRNSRKKSSKSSPTAATASANSVAAQCVRRSARPAASRRSNARPRPKPCSTKRVSRAAGRAVCKPSASQAETPPLQRRRPLSRSPKTDSSMNYRMIPTGLVVEKPSATSPVSRVGPRVARKRIASKVSPTNALDGTVRGDRAEPKRATTRFA
jgi:hypothetical protein